MTVSFCTQAISRYHQHTVSFIDDNIGPRRHRRQQFAFRVGYIYINSVINDVVFGNSFAGYQSYDTFKSSVRIGIDSKAYFLPYFYLSDIGFIDHGFDLHIIQIGNRHDDLRFGNTGADSLPNRGRLAYDITGNRRGNDRIINIRGSLVIVCFRNCIIGFRQIIIRLGNSAFSKQRTVTVISSQSIFHFGLHLCLRGRQRSVV